jgi:hypothetical protein
MKEFRFPKSITFRLNLDRDDSVIGFPSSSAEDMATIERNRAEILSAMITVEERIVEAVSNLLVSESKEKRDFFSGEIIGTSDFSFSFKRRVFTRMLEQFGLIEAEKIKQLKANLLTRKPL